VSYDLRDKVVLITGAAGGIGAATAQALYDRGTRLVLTDMTQAAVDELAARFAAERVLPLALDVTDATATAEVLRRAVERFGRLDVSFANAGIAWRDAPATIAVCDPAEFEKIVAVDLFGVWRTVKASLPEVIRNQGQVLITASIYAFLNGMVNSPYAASKAAVEMLGRALRVELAGTGATASVLYPGWVTTPMTRLVFGGHETATRFLQTALPSFLRRPIEPDAVAAAVVKGLESRRPRIIVPARWAPFSMLRGVFGALTDSYLAGNPRLTAIVRELERNGR
jgi:NAD(P)-dependent dehydrogenase (short-subunit alcohol dehydrogenase family)